MAIRILNNNYGGRVSISSRGLGGRFSYAADPVPLLLDTYGSAAAAYSVRKLRNGYGGSAIRVRRSSDSAETDIGFVLGQLDTTSLSTFVGTQNNLIPYSEDFTQWTLFNSATVNANATTDPIGGNTADRLNFGSLNTSQVYYFLTLVTNLTYVISVYAKSDTKSKFRLKVSDGTTDTFSSDFTISSTWTRYDYTYTFTAMPNVYTNVAIVNESAGGAGAIFIWGAQFNIRTLQTYTQTTGTAKNNDGFVTKWYDQSGNVRDTIQATTANQPRIVYGGSITYINGKPTVENIASSYLATTQTSFTTLQTHSDFIVTKGLTQSQPNNYVGYLVFGPSSGNDFGNTVALTINAGEISTGKNLDIGASGYSIIGSGLVTDHRLISHIINSQSGQAFSNRIPIASANGTFATTNNGSLYIGTRYTGGAVNTSYSYLGYFQEIITYNSSQLTNRTAIESNINAYYSLYTDNGVWQGTGTALLDTYPSASAAYSTRNLSSTYTGSLIRVRRSSDNAELDITGTSAGNLDTDLLLAFVGSGNGFVTRWYDQSGNARHMLQTGNANQPTIVSAGSIILQNGKPCVKFTAASGNYFITTAGGYTTTAMSVFSAFSYTNNTAQYGRILSHTPASGLDSSAGYIPILRDSNFNKISSYSISTDTNPFIASINVSLSTGILFSNIATGTAVTNYLNSTTSSTISFNLNITRTSMVMGSSGGSVGAHYDGNMSELVMYLSNQTSNRTVIESNINSYYSIY